MTVFSFALALGLPLFGQSQTPAIQVPAPMSPVTLQVAAPLSPPDSTEEDAVMPVAPAPAKPHGYTASNGPVKLPPFMQQADTMPKTTATWSEDVYNFGKLPASSTAVHTFTFRNTGDKPLVITMAKASCGCTVPDWTRTPVAPGQEGFVNISFHTGAASGTQTKSVTVIHNSMPIAKVLRFTAEVE